LFAWVGPYILGCPNDALMETHFETAVQDLWLSMEHASTTSWHLESGIYQSFKVQMMALKLADISMQGAVNGGMALFWSLTELGKATLLALRSAKKVANQDA
jgi:hypothetical protein